MRTKKPKTKKVETDEDILKTAFGYPTSHGPLLGSPLRRYGSRQEEFELNLELQRLDPFQSSDEAFLVRAFRKTTITGVRP